MKGAKCFGRRFLYWVGHAEQACKLIVNRDKHHCLPVPTKRFSAFAKIAGCTAKLVHEVPIADDHHATADAALHALTGDRLKVANFSPVDAALLSAANNGGRQRMLAYLFETGGQPQQLALISASD